jgi:hypothetical protein
VTAIGEEAFFSCHKLTSVTIGNSVTNINFFAFAYCISLAEIHVKAKNPPQISEYTFSGVSTSIPVYVCGSVEDYRRAAYWSEFTNILQDNDCGVGIENIYGENEIRFYPNPVTERQFTIENEQWTATDQAEIYNIQGICVATYKLTESRTTINISQLSAGMYFIRVKTSKGMIVKKILISK